MEGGAKNRETPNGTTARMRNCVLVGLLLAHSILGFCQNPEHSLESFFEYDPNLEHQVDEVFMSLSDTQRVAQMIVTSAGELGKPAATVKKLVDQNKVGGVIFLKGTRAAHSNLVSELDSISNLNGSLPLLFSMDAEPSLFNGRVKGSQKLINTIDIENEADCDSIVTIINDELLGIGVRQNFAPVCDLSPNNEAIKNRSFGSDLERVVSMSKAFITSSQSQGVVATAKHFPGHGLVKGDTHKQSVYIDGPLQELEVYPPLIEAGVLSIMVAHITVNNNDEYGTDGLPSSCSRKIVTDLLKTELGFKGIVITDALNIMKAVTILDDAPLQASKAGCDVLLMPIDESNVIQSILAEIEKDEAYRRQVYSSVKKIIRLKICLGLIPETR